MLMNTILALASSVSTVSAAAYVGFNYGSGLNYSAEFALAKKLVGTNGIFTSARLYTMIEQGSVNTPTSAINASIANDVTLLLGLWASAGQADFNNELAALKSAITTYGTAFTSRVAGIGVGSEDLYRISPTGVVNKSGVGAEPADIINYISQVRSTIAGTTLSAAPVGHIDTWNSWTNSSNSGVVDASDFLGLDAYPYFQNTQVNAVSDGHDLFFSAYDQTVQYSKGKPVWVTETGWPVSGATQNLAVPSVANAQAYWDSVGCQLFGTINTYWYILNDSGAVPSFGVTTGSNTPLFDLTCNASTSGSTSSSSAAGGAAAASTGSGVSSSVTTLPPVTSTSQSLVSVSSTVSAALASGTGSSTHITSSSADSSASSSSASSIVAAAGSDSSMTVSTTTTSVTSTSSGTTSSGSSSTASSTSTSTGTAATPSSTGAAATTGVPAAFGLVAAVVGLLAFI